MITDDIDLMQPLALTVDDDEINRMMTRVLLEQQGFRVVEAEDGAKALAVFEKLQPDLVLLDLLMPEIDGFEVCAAIRSLPGGYGRHAVILVMTGLNDMESINRAYEAGGTDFIVKPINWMILGKRLRYIRRAICDKQKLRESEANLCRTQKIAKLGSWEWCPTSNKIVFTDGYFNILGTDPGHFGENLDSLIEAIVHPEDRKLVLQAADQARQSGIGQTVEYRIIRPDNDEVRWIRAIGEFVYEQDKIVRMIGADQDITERKQMEESLREAKELLTLFVKHSPIFAYIKDTAPTCSRVLMASDNFREMVGIPGSDMVGKTMEELFPAEFAAKITADDWAVVSNGHVIKLDENLNGRYYTTVKFPITHGGKCLLAGYTIDITDRKRSEEQTFRLQKAESLERMAGAIAHNFNNQLQAVIGNIEMAMDAQPEGSKFLSEALKSAHKAAELSGLMLTYRGQMTGKHEPVDLSEVCRQTIPLLQAAAPKSMVIKIDFPTIGPVIRANAAQIQQILSNLVINAWEAAGESRGIIGLSVKTVSLTDIPLSKRFPFEWQPHESIYACLEVTDTGSGITSRDIDKLFDPFYTSKFVGRGMGLPVVLGITTAHGGGITVKSEPGQGSIFQVYFPLSTGKILFHTDKAVRSSEIRGGGIVLLIEDEAQVRDMANIMLTRLGYSVLEARDGMDGVEIFQQHRDEIRCVITDLTMPRMNGWDTLAALRKISPDIPVILSSGYDEAHVMADDHPEQPNAFLGKPYELKRLRETVNGVLAIVRT